MKYNPIVRYTFLVVFLSCVHVAAQTNGNDDAYDTGAFDKIKWGNNELLKPYLECYAKKHNLELLKVTDGAFRARGFQDSKEMKATLLEEQQQLAEIGRQLKSQLKSRPNTGKSYQYNPGIWEEIINNLTEYMPCAIGGEQSRRMSESVYMKRYLEDIKKMQKEVDDYDPTERNYLVSSSTADYLLYAVSKRERAKWLSDSVEFKPTLDPLLDSLAASAAKKLPLYKALPSWFKFRDAAAEKQIMGIFKTPASVKVQSIGVEDSGWQIQKDNYGLLPSYRYKNANVYYRDSSDDHPFCRVASVRVKQDYAGGGRYSPEAYRSSARITIIGCPPGK